MISLTSTSGGCPIANAMASAIADGGMARARYSCPHGVDRFEVDGLTGGGDAEKVAEMSGVVGLVGGDDAFVDCLPMDLGPEVGKRVTESLVQDEYAGFVGRGAGLRGVVDEVVGEQFVEQSKIALTLDLFGVAAHHHFQVCVNLVACYRRRDALTSWWLGCAVGRGQSSWGTVGLCGRSRSMIVRRGGQLDRPRRVTAYAVRRRGHTTASSSSPAPVQAWGKRCPPIRRSRLTTWDRAPDAPPA
jgi:hypothetical protein